MTRDRLRNIVNSLPMSVEVNDRATAMAIELAKYDRDQLESKINRLSFAIQLEASTLRRREEQAAEALQLAIEFKRKDAELNLGHLAIDTICWWHKQNIKDWTAEKLKYERALQRIEKRLAELRQAHLKVGEWLAE